MMHIKFLAWVVGVIVISSLMQLGLNLINASGFGTLFGVCSFIAFMVFTGWLLVHTFRLWR